MLNSLFQQYWSLKHVLLSRRKMHGYCIGAPKSGTHSMSNIFCQRYHASHEPGDLCEFVNIFRREPFYAIRNPRYKKFFRSRDRQLYLDLESSHLLGPFAGLLHETFPEARFILPIRDCYSWLDSMLNHQINGQLFGQHTAKYTTWLKVYDFYFQPHKFKHSKMEKVLSEHHLFTLDGYFAYWNAHYSHAISSICEDRLLILRTNDITTSQKKLAEFLEISQETIDMSNHHVYWASAKHHLLQHLDQNFLEQKAAEHCADLMQRFFPEIREAGDVLAYAATE